MVAASVMAALTPTGPWQPLSVILGWLAVALIVVGVVGGFPSWLAAGVAVLVVRTGVHGLAGDPAPGLALAALLLTLMLELAALSMELRLIPVRAWLGIVRAAVVALVAALGVAGVMALMEHVAGGNHLAALAAAGVVGLLVVGLGRAVPAGGGDHPSG